MNPFFCSSYRKHTIYLPMLQSVLIYDIGARALFKKFMLKTQKKKKTVSQ